MKSENRK